MSKRGAVLSKHTGKHTKIDPVKRRHKRIAMGVCIALVAVVACAGAAAAMLSHSVQDTIAYEDNEFEEVEQVLVEEEEEEDPEPYYVLILGSDARNTEAASSRSDTIILARVDVEDSLVTLISIPRDTIVDIEGYGTQKINAAYALGGASLAVSTISEYAGVDIAHCVEVHFEEAVDVVDELGGVEIDVEQSISVEGVTLEPGTQTLTGEQALAYARDRKHVTGGDFGRAKAQREVIMAVADKALSCSVTKLPSVVRQLAQCVTTDYKLSELVDLAQAFYGEDLDFYSTICPSYTYNVDGISYVATMYDEWRELMQRVDAGLDPDDEDAEIPDEQLSDPDLGSAANALGPEDYESLAAGSLNTSYVEDDDEDEDEEDEDEDEEITEDMTYEEYSSQ